MTLMQKLAGFRSSRHSLEFCLRSSCDEAEAYAHRGQAASVPVALTRYQGMADGFFAMSGILDDARTALRQVSGFLRTELAKEPIHGS